MSDYIIHQSEYIVKHYNTILTDLEIAHKEFKKLFPDNDSTWSYSVYNIFALTAPSSRFYDVYKELRNLIRSHLGEERPLWIQAWLNYHKQDEVLDWHEHGFDYHGYISIDPKKTKTLFPTYEIDNKCGQIYFGPGHRQHKVEVLEPYNDYRLTIGFDVHSLPDSPYVNMYEEKPFKNMSLIPLL